MQTYTILFIIATFFLKLFFASNLTSMGSSIWPSYGCYFGLFTPIKSIDNGRIISQIIAAIRSSFCRVSKMLKETKYYA